MKYLIIINPTSGRSYAETVIPKIEECLNAHNLDFEIMLTERPWQAAELAEEAAKMVSMLWFRQAETARPTKC